MFVAIKTSESESSSLHQHFPLLWKAQNSRVGYDNDNYSKGRGNFFYQDLSKPLQSFKGSRDRMTYWILEFEPRQSLVMHCFFFTCATQVKYLLCVQIVLGVPPRVRQTPSKCPQSGWDSSVLTTLFFSTSHFSDLSSPQFPHQFPLLSSPSLYSFTFR